MTTQSNIDLTTCVRGQKVRLRDGAIVEYEGLIQDSTVGPWARGPFTHIIDGCSYAYINDGFYWEDRRESPRDVVEILSMEPPMHIDWNTQYLGSLATCVRGQKVKLRDGTIATYNGVIDENEIYTYAVDGYRYTKDGSFWEEPDCISPKDVVEILPMEEEPAKPTPELTHSITDQIDMVNPDHVSIIPHEHGVTICIKKGLTTISWRHYND